MIKEYTHNIIYLNKIIKEYNNCEDNELKPYIDYKTIKTIQDIIKEELT